MKNNSRFFYHSVFSVIISTGILMLSCNKKFDEPPVYVAPDITADLSIKDLKAIHVFGNFEQITDDRTIEGIVVADDKSGNFYKSIVIQDATGGITVRLDAYDLYTDYPVGRKLFIKMKGLYIGDYNRLIQIGGGIDNSGSSPTMAPIASTLISKYLVKGTLDNIVTPKVVTTLQLADSLQSTLIQLDNFEFATADTSKTFADPTLASSAINFTLKNCEGSSIILRSSSYADFAGYGVPNGNGSIIAVYTVFGSTKQLNIRDTSDVKFGGARCFNEDFSGAVSGSDIALTGWMNTAEKGTVIYKAATFSGNNFAKISAFGSADDAARSWLITPAIDVSRYSNPKFSFDNADGYDNGATLTIYISPNFNGYNNTPWSSATWTPVAANISHGHSTGYGSFINSGYIDLSNYSGQVHIAFVYEGADPAGSSGDKTTTFEIDNVKVISY